MSFPAAYLPMEKNFLESVFRTYPSIRTAFNACAEIYPPDRVEKLRKNMTQQPRRIWKDLGIPSRKCETLADHAGEMAKLVHQYPQEEDADTMALIRAWGVVRAVADEIPFEDMAAPERGRLYSLAARLVFDHFGSRTLHDHWERLNETYSGESTRSRDAALCARIWPDFSPDDLMTEEEWVHDLDFLVTAAQARAYQKGYPRLAGALEGIVRTCHNALITDTARTLWDKIVKPAPVKQEATPEPAL